MPPTRLKFAEVTNGRMAMIGLSVLLLSGVLSGQTVIASFNQIDLQTIWWLIGVYSS
tara:strand:- start:902 stop:1072 length:171 start_codon:yes stop_codon:yes gene_type:complete